MRFIPSAKALLGAAAAAALAACSPTGPAPTTATGSADRPLEQRTLQQPHSPNASAGAPTITGSNGRGEPVIQRSDPTTGGVGGVGPAPRPAGSGGGDKGS